MALLAWGYGGVAARCRALVVCGVLVDVAEGQQRGRLDGTGAKVSGRASEALMAGQRASVRYAALLYSALECRSEAREREREDRERRERVN